MGNSTFVTRDGSEIYYEMTGSGPAVVLIHGFALDSRIWDPQVEALSDHFSVLRYDLRGFGKSDLPGAEPYSHSDDLKQLLERLEISKATIIGLSLGGMVAIDLALRNPGVVDKLILTDSALGGFELVEFNNSFGKVVEIAFSAGINEAKSHFASFELFKSAASIPSVANLLWQILSDYSGWHFMNDNPAIWVDPPAVDQLNIIKMPTLIIIGELDSGEFQEISEILKQRITDSVMTIIPNVGHVSNLENPDIFNQITLDFLLEQES
jgi:3-oxoadipate enol-lactonase